MARTAWAPSGGNGRSSRSRPRPVARAGMTCPSPGLRKSRATSAAWRRASRAKMLVGPRPSPRSPSRCPPRAAPFAVRPSTPWRPAPAPGGPSAAGPHPAIHAQPGRRGPPSAARAAQPVALPRRVHPPPGASRRRAASGPRDGSTRPDSCAHSGGRRSAAAPPGRPDRRSCRAASSSPYRARCNASSLSRVPSAT